MLTFALLSFPRLQLADIQTLFRVRCSFEGKDGHVVADQLRAVDRDRLVKQLGRLSETTLYELLGVLQAMFAV